MPKKYNIYQSQLTTWTLVHSTFDKSLHDEQCALYWEQGINIDVEVFNVQLKKGEKMTKKEIIQKAMNWLDQQMVRNDYIESVIFTLFKEAVWDSENKTELLKIFTTYCNNELGRSYLIGDAIYLLLKEFIRCTKIRFKG